MRTCDRRPRLALRLAFPVVTGLLLSLQIGLAGAAKSFEPIKPSVPTAVARNHSRRVTDENTEWFRFTRSVSNY